MIAPAKRPIAAMARSGRKCSQVLAGISASAFHAVHRKSVSPHSLSFLGRNRGSAMAIKPIAIPTSPTVAAPRLRSEFGARSKIIAAQSANALRSEEHTSELQSPYDLVCRLLLEKKKKK